MMSLLLIPGTAAAVFAYIGRAVIPCQRRPPLTQWTLHDVYWNARHGLPACSSHSILS